MISGSSFRHSGYNIPSRRGGSWTKKETIAAGVVVLIALILLAFLFWPSSSPIPPPSPSPTPPSDWKPYCTFKATGNNKDHFSIDADSEQYNLFPIDLAQTEYNQAISYDEGEYPITCQYNASTRSPKYASSGPTTNGYSFPTTPQIPQVFTPDDGTQTKSGDTCEWSPKEYLCNTPICSFNRSYSSVVIPEIYKEQGIKQYLSQEELDKFISNLSCPGGTKYGQCSSKTPSSSGTQCSKPEKQNNKINCLGNCSGAPNIQTKEACESAKDKWIYDETGSQCKYTSLNKPIINANSIPRDSNGNYRMCDNPGDFVDVDSMVNASCSNTCYPNPNNDHIPPNTNEMPLSWTDQCGFTSINDKIFNTNTYYKSPCGNHTVWKGQVYYNICKSENCSNVKSNIENNVHLASPISSPCQGGGDIFDVYNNCKPASCDSIFNRSATSSLAQCPNNQVPKPPSPSPDANLAIPLPPASDCNPDLPKKFSITDYISKVAGNCCVDKTCADEYPNCPTGYSRPSPIPSPSPGSSGNTLSFHDCCVLETCSKYMEGEQGGQSKQCVDGSTHTKENENIYILPTCCNGYIQINTKLNIGINNFMKLSSTDMNSPLTNVFPSYILKQLLQPSTSITLNSINPTSINKSSDNLYFINNQTTFMDPLPTDKQTMDKALIQSQESFRLNISKLGNQNEYNFYILTSQKYDKSNSVISFNISEAYTTIKNITDNISKSDSDPNISKINASLTDCMDAEDPERFQGICDIISSSTSSSMHDKVLNGEPDNSYCCFKSTCGNVLTQDQKAKLSDSPSSPTMNPGWKACGGGTFFDEDAPWPSPPSNPTYINASNQCCVSGNITAYKPDTPDKTITDLYKTYVTKKDPNNNDILLPNSIGFQWVNGKFEPKDTNTNKNLADVYKCMYNASIPKYGVSKHSNGTYYYKLTGCEDGDNIFCKIPNPYSKAPSNELRYDDSIYDLTGLMQNNIGNYISMYATTEDASESKREGEIMANYGGILCTDDPYSTVDVKRCDEPYDYIKFSGCNTYFSEEGRFQFYTRTTTPNDCYGLTTSASCNDGDYANMCTWNASTTPGVCEPRPFPLYGGVVGESCGDKLNADENFSDAFWLKEGFQNQNYEDNNIFEKGDSTRIIQTPSPSPGSSGPPASSREVSRRINYCGYKPKSQQTNGDSDQFNSRVVDSTWMCKDKTCKEDNNINIQLPKDLPNLTSFTSYVNGDPLIYEWEVNGNGTTVSQPKKEFYYGNYSLTNQSFTVDDYRPVQGPPLTTFNLTDQSACVKTPSSSPSSSPCDRPTASPGAKPSCDPSCKLTPFTEINDLNSGDNVTDRTTNFTQIQEIGGADYNASQMEYVHNNIKYHNNYATMCGDNKYLSFFDFENENGGNYQKCTPCRYQRDPYPPSPPAPNTYNEFYTTELNKLNSDEQSYMNQYVYPKSSDASKPLFLSGVISPSSTSSDCSGGQSKATNEIDGWDKCITITDKDTCNNSFYFWPKDDPRFPGTDEYYNCLYNEGKNECESPKNSQPCKNTDKITDKTNNYCCYTPTSTLTSTPTSTSTSPTQSPPSSLDYIINETSPNKDDKNKMSNCSINSSKKRTEIPIGEYSTHFVPWWSESSATDLKIKDDADFKTLSNKLGPDSQPINIPTCDLHKDRCEDITSKDKCNVNASQSWASPSLQNINMCAWSPKENKCMTNPDWRNEQIMCGHPCLSRIDAKPRECKFSDDCEIRDRYNFSQISDNANLGVNMYCDSYGRNPILYGTPGLAPGPTNDVMDENNVHCNEGYYLVHIGDSVNVERENQSVYKCLSCDELNSYLLDGGSGSAVKNDMLGLFEQYINACGTEAQKQYYIKSRGQWKENNTPNGKTCSKTANCTAFVWPSSATSADPYYIQGNKIISNADVLYTQDPVVADQYIKYKIGDNYRYCTDEGKGKKDPNSVYCKTYISAMEKILGLKTRDYDQDSKHFKGYNASKTIGDIGVEFLCDYPSKEPNSYQAKWGTMTDSQAINVIPGGMVVNSSYTRLRKPNDELIKAGDICPNRATYLTGGGDTEKTDIGISYLDRYWPATEVAKNNKSYTYCKPLIEIGSPCNDRKSGELACMPDPGRANQYKSYYTSDDSDGYELGANIPYAQKMGICGIADDSGKGVKYDQGGYVCLAGKPPGAPCTAKNDYECMEFSLRDSDTNLPTDPPLAFYGARCSSPEPWSSSKTCDGPGHMNEILEDWSGFVNPTEVCENSPGDPKTEKPSWCDHSEEFIY